MYSAKPVHIADMIAHCSYPCLLVQVKPIVGNKLIEIIDGFDFQASMLPFGAMPLDALPSMSPADFEAHLTTVCVTP